MPASFIFTSESVSEGHPDKVCDYIADSVLDAHLAQDPASRVACEVLCKDHHVVLAGEISSRAVVDVEAVARAAIREIGYTDPAARFNADEVRRAELPRHAVAAHRAGCHPRRRNRRRRPGPGLRLRDTRNARTDAPADQPGARRNARARGRTAPRQRAVAAPRRQGAGLGALRQRHPRRGDRRGRLHAARAGHAAGRDPRVRRRRSCCHRASVDGGTTASARS